MQTGKRLWALMCCMLMIFLPTSQAAQPLESGTPMTLTTPSAILAETATGTVIFEKNADERREVASITKLMTALLVLEALDRDEIALTDSVQISPRAASNEGFAGSLRCERRLSAGRPAAHDHHGVRKRLSRRAV